MKGGEDMGEITNGTNGAQENVKRVLIAEGTKLFAQLLETVVNSTAGFTVCGTAADAYEARDLIEKVRPDMIVLDGNIPGMSAAGFIRQVLPQYTVPIIVCAQDQQLLIRTMSAGAADYLIRPGESGYEEFKTRLVRAMKAAASLRRLKSGCTYYNVIRPTRPPKEKNSATLIAIGGSAGSTEALPEVLKGFCANTPPIAVALHLPEGYTSLFARRLSAESGLNVVEAKRGLYLEKGMTAIAPGDMHMRIFRDSKGYFASCEKGVKVSGHCPSVDVMFESVAACAAADAVGIILTGMGSDGAKGLAAMHNAGAYTIGQSERTCAVYGMPKAAFAAGALDRQCDLEEIAGEVNVFLARKKKF